MLPPKKKDSFLPTRMEWLDVELAAKCREHVKPAPNTEVALEYLPSGRDTVQAHVVYWEGTPPMELTNGVKRSKECAMQLLENHGWHDIRIEVITLKL